MVQISDVYVVESLLQSTEAFTNPLCWQEIEQAGFASVGYLAQIGLIEIMLHTVSGITGGRLWLTLSDKHGRVHLQEPEPTGWLGRKYRCEEDRRLAGAMNQLRRAIVRQCHQREVQAHEQAGAIRERIFSQLLFGGRGLQTGD